MLPDSTLLPDARFGRLGGVCDERQMIFDGLLELRFEIAVGHARELRRIGAADFPNTARLRSLRRRVRARVAARRRCRALRASSGRAKRPSCARPCARATARTRQPAPPLPFGTAIRANRRSIISICIASKNPAELHELGLEEAFDGRSIAFVEWWTHAPSLLPARRYEVTHRGRRAISRAASRCSAPA